MIMIMYFPLRFTYHREDFYVVLTISIGFDFSSNFLFPNSMLHTIVFNDLASGSTLGIRMIFIS